MPMTWESCYNASPDRHKAKPRKCEYCGLPVRQGKMQWIYLTHEYQKRARVSSRGFILQSSYPQRKYSTYAYTHKKCQDAFRLTSRLHDDYERGQQDSAIATKEYMAQFPPGERFQHWWQPYWYWICRNIFPGYEYYYTSRYYFWKDRKYPKK